MRGVVLVLSGAVGCLLGGLIAFGGAPTAPGGREVPPVGAGASASLPRDSIAAADDSRTGAQRALEVYDAWNRRRARAYAVGGPSDLLRLYAPHSSAAREDRAILRGYRERGLVVRGMAVQVLEVHATAKRRDCVALVVTDRQLTGRVVGRQRSVPLPAPPPETRLLRWSAAAGEGESPWRLVEARRLRPVETRRFRRGEAQRSAAAIRSRTSLCANA